MPASDSAIGADAGPFNLTTVDYDTLALADEQFHLHTWEELRAIIANNDLHLLKRTPSDLRRYGVWCQQIKSTHGSIPNFIMRERLQWTPMAEDNVDCTAPSEPGKPGLRFQVVNPEPFASVQDYKILLNDWPYGLEPGITHLVVWLKQRLETDPKRGGDLTTVARRQVEAFVQNVVQNQVDRFQPTDNTDRVQWFKNWTTIQSVPGLEHIHVLIRDVGNELVAGLTARPAQTDESPV